MDAKKITLCADDYSFTPAISEAIIQLASQDRVSAISCMTNTKYWETHANRLKPYANKMDIGLHFTLTDVPPVHVKQLTHPNLMLKAYTKRLNLESIKSEIKTQIDRFQQHFGRLPDFIDGHQHVHQLPVVRKALLAVYQETFSEAACYIRVPSSGLMGIKNLLITLSGALSLKRALSRRCIPFNTSFSGVYNFSQAPHYPEYFRRFLHQVRSGGLIMCHPGLYNESTTDCIAKQRWYEYQYLNGKEFLEDCEKNRVQLTRFSLGDYN